VGVVIARVRSKVRFASAQANVSTRSSTNFGMVVWSRMFSAMTWFVAMTGMPRCFAMRASPRPITMWDWMCTTSGCTASSTFRA